MIDSNKKLEAYLRTEFDELRNKGSIISPSSKYFGEIGSTQNEDIPYVLQLKVKQNAVKEIFSNIIDDSILYNLEITGSPITDSYRFKMEFVCSYNPIHEPHERFGQRKKNNFSWVIDMDSCNLIDAKVFKDCRKIYEEIKKLGISNYDLKKSTGKLRYLTIKPY